MERISRNDAMKEIRSTARQYGLVFKKRNIKINNSPSFRFDSRASGQTIISNCTFWSAYELANNGVLQENAQRDYRYLLVFSYDSGSYENGDVLSTHSTYELAQKASKKSGYNTFLRILEEVLVDGTWRKMY